MFTLTKEIIMVIKEKYDTVIETFNADGDWLDVFIEYCPFDDFTVVRVIGGDTEGNLVDAVDRYDWKAELGVEEAIKEMREPDL